MQHQSLLSSQVVIIIGFVHNWTYGFPSSEVLHFVVGFGPLLIALKFQVVYLCL